MSKRSKKAKAKKDKKTRSFFTQVGHTVYLVVRDTGADEFPVKIIHGFEREKHADSFCAECTELHPDCSYRVVPLPVW